MLQKFHESVNNPDPSVACNPVVDAPEYAFPISQVGDSLDLDHPT